jgi:hypothetical protein
MTTAKVYRNGAVEVGKHSPSIVESWFGYDSFKPAGRSGRLESIYASPTLPGLIRWVRGNHLTSAKNPDVDLTNNEITVVNPEDIYVYSIELYDRFFSYDGVSEEDAKAYWDSGIPLSDWEKVSTEQNLRASEWEVLIPAEKVKTVRKISDARIVKSAPEIIADTISQILKDRKEFLKWCNWEPEVAA